MFKLTDFLQFDQIFFNHPIPCIHVYKSTLFLRFYVQNTALDLYTEHSFGKKIALAYFQLKCNLRKMKKYFKSPLFSFLN